jgi:hypothetical protein
MDTFTISNERNWTKFDRIRTVENWIAMMSLIKPLKKIINIRYSATGQL